MGSNDHRAEKNISRIKRWIAPPVFPNNKEKTRRANMLNLALIIFLILLLVILIGNLIGGKTPIPVIGVNIVAVPICLVLYYWMRQGRIRLASIGLMALGLIGITTGVASLGTVRVPTTAMYLLMVITAGLLFDLTGMVATTAICSLLIAGLILAGNAGLLPPPDYSLTITQWISYTAILAWAGSLTFLALKSMHNALEQADNEIAERKLAEAELAEHRNHLEELVKERTDELDEKNSQLIGEITEHKRTEETLRETNEYLENLFSNANAPIIVWDHQFKISRLNQAFEILSGRSARQIIGEPLELLFPSAQVAGSMEFIRKTSACERLETIELDIIHLDGSIRTVLWNSAAIFASDGTTLIATIAQGQDVTERKKAEEKLKESEGKYRSLFNNVADAILIHDLEGHFLGANDEAVKRLGHSRDKLLALTPEDLDSPDHARQVKDRIEEILHNGFMVFESVQKM